MVDGAVGYHRPENVRRIEVEKNNAIVKAINKTKDERHPNLAQLQQDRLREIQLQQKAERKAAEKQKRLAELEAKRKEEELSYDRLYKQENMTNTAGELNMNRNIINCMLFGVERLTRDVVYLLPFHA